MKDPVTAKTFRRWLAAERRGASAAAEQALAALLARLPEARPRPGFADRVLAAAGLAAAPALRPALVWPGRALVAACLLVTAVAVAYLPALAVLITDQVTVAGMVSFLVSTFTRAIDYLALAIAIGEILATLYEALLRVVLSPPVAFAWLGALVFSTWTLRWLVQLLSPQRKAEYASAQ